MGGTSVAGRWGIASGRIIESDVAPMLLHLPASRHNPFQSLRKRARTRLMRDAFICDYVRTPIGRYGGALSGMRTDDLAAQPLKSLMARHARIDWEQIDGFHFKGERAESPSHPDLDLPLALGGVGSPVADQATCPETKASLPGSAIEICE